MSAYRSAFYCKISLESENQLTSYCQKSDFQDGGHRHVEFFKISTFGHVTPFAIVYRISSTSDYFFTEIWRFNDFQNGGRPPSWILKICSFCYVAQSTYRSASSYKISLKSDNRSMSYGQKSDFQDGGRRHLKC